MGKWCLQASSFIFYQIFVKLAGNQDSHKISDEFEFQLGPISHFGVTCPCGRIKFSIDILWCLHLFSVVFDQILFILQVMRTCIKSRMSLTFGQFGPLTMESVTSKVRAHKGQIKFSIDILWNLQVQLTFQTWEFFVTLFSGTVRPRRLKLGTHVGSGQMYHVYWNRAAAAYSSLYSFFFPIFNIEIFRSLFSGTVRPRRLKLGTHVDSGQM